MKKTFSIKTLGCKLNQYESTRMTNELLNSGWDVKPFGQEVDMVIVNTCTVTDKSDKKCKSYIKQGAKLSKIGKSIVTGCMAENNRESLKCMPEVLGIFGNKGKDDVIDRIVDIVPEFKDEFVVLENVDFNRGPVPVFRTRGSIKVQDGCDQGCTYCVIPSVRGVPQSRPFKDIIDDAKKLIDQNYSEIVLTGITIGKYDYDGLDIADLLNSLIQLNGKFRVRVTSIEPVHVTDKLLDLMASNKVCNHIHLPLQSGSAEILKKMNRPYSPKEYREAINRIMSKNDEIAIGTDIIIGFPGETEEDFVDSIKMIEWAKFAYVHQFTFSPRSGTPAALMEQRSTSNEIFVRGNRMRKVASEYSLKYRERFKGRILTCVIEKSKGDKKAIARSDNYLRILINKDSDGLDSPDGFHNIKILDVNKEENIGETEMKRTSNGPVTD